MAGDITTVFIVCTVYGNEGKTRIHTPTVRISVLNMHWKNTLSESSTHRDTRGNDKQPGRHSRKPTRANEDESQRDHRCQLPWTPLFRGDKKNTQQFQRYGGRGKS
jgi:hypothetical protein